MMFKIQIWYVYVIFFFNHLTTVDVKKNMERCGWRVKGQGQTIHTEWSWKVTSFSLHHMLLMQRKWKKRGAKSHGDKDRNGMSLMVVITMRTWNTAPSYHLPLVTWPSMIVSHDPIVGGFW